MKKLLFLSALLLLCGQAALYGQGGKWFNTFETRVGGVVLSQQKAQAISVQFAAGYSITDRFSVAVPVEGTFGLFNYDPLRNYQTSCALGLKLGYDVISNKQLSLNLSGGALYSLAGEHNWRYVDYDLGARLGFKRGNLMPYVGLGAVIYDSLNDKFNSFSNLYIAFGLRF